MSSHPPHLWLAALVGSVSCLALGACGEHKPAAAIKPAKAEPVAHESELLKLTLTPEAEQRLGLQTIAATAGATRRTRTSVGEIVAPPLPGGLPTASGVDLSTLAASQAQADGDVGARRAEVVVAQKALTRAEALVAAEAGSVRARDEAESALGVARASLAAAQARRAMLGQSVAAMGRGGAVWVRVSTFAADLAEIDRGAAAQVRPLGASGAALPARPVQGPPSANAAAGAVDVYYALANSGGLQVGQRVEVALPLRGDSAGLMIPASALLHDAYGGEWVYVRSGEHAYERRRVEVADAAGGALRLARGWRRATRW